MTKPKTDEPEVPEVPVKEPTNDAYQDGEAGVPDDLPDEPDEPADGDDELGDPNADD